MVDPKDPNAQFNDKYWDEEASVQLLRDGYKDWNPVVKALTEVTPDLRFHPNLSCSQSLPTWVFGDSVTLIGDAAHAHGGAHATGGSIAIDDAYALYLSILSIFPLDSSTKPARAEIGKALKLYEATRKPHADRLLKLVHAANTAKAEKIRTGKVESDEELRERARKGSNTTWLHEHDVIKTFEETLKRREVEDVLSDAVKISAKF